MAPKTIDRTDLAAALEDIRREVARLSERTAALESALLPTANRKFARESDNGFKAEGLDEELVMVISAAIAAFLGVKPRIRQIVLVESKPWSQQGRVTIQASHSLRVHHG